MESPKHIQSVVFTTFGCWKENFDYLLSSIIQKKILTALKFDQEEFDIDIRKKHHTITNRAYFGLNVLSAPSPCLWKSKLLIVFLLIDSKMHYIWMTYTLIVNLGLFKIPKPNWVWIQLQQLARHDGLSLSFYLSFPTASPL